MRSRVRSLVGWHKPLEDSAEGSGGGGPGLRQNGVGESGSGAGAYCLGNGDHPRRPGPPASQWGKIGPWSPLLSCLGSPHGTFSWSQALFYIFFSGVGHFPSCREYGFLMHFALCLGVKTVQKGFHLTSQARFRKAGPLVGMDWHHLSLQNLTFQSLALQRLSVNELAQEKLAL